MDTFNTNYGFSSSYAEHDTVRRAQGTDYAKCQGLYVDTSPGKYNGNSYWWLRTPCSYSYLACHVSLNGYVNYGGHSVDNSSDGVRPTLKLNLQSLEETEATSSIQNATYVQQEDTHKTFTVTADGRQSMIQFIEPDGGTRTYDRYNKNVSITSYDIEGNIVNAMSRDLAYEVWEIYSNMSVGVEINVRGKENGIWDSAKYSFVIEEYNPVFSMELSATSGGKGAVPATVVADENTEKVMFKMPNDTSSTVSTFTTDENGNRVFTGKAWMNEDGTNEIKVYTRRDNVWKLVGTLEYTVE